MERTRFVAALRSALAQLNDFQKLRNNPLLTILIAGEHGGPLQLQQCLLEAIEGLRHSGQPNAARAHAILYQRYVEQIPQREVAFQLGVSVRQLRREQTNAIELLAAMLGPEPDAKAEAEPADSRTGVENELDWLRTQFAESASDLLVEIKAALQNLDGLARHHHVQPNLIVTTSLPEVAAPAPIIRQALVAALTVAITRTECARLRIAASATATVAYVIVSQDEARPGMYGAWRAAQLAPLQVAHQLLTEFGGSIQHFLQPNLVVEIIVPVVRSIPALVVDDNPDTRLLFQRYAESSRYQISVAPDGPSALAMAAVQRPAVIVLDIMMPFVDGWELLHRLRSHAATAHVPVAVCSILPQQDLAHFLGASAFLQKPVSQADFLHTLDRLTASPVTAPG